LERQIRPWYYLQSNHNSHTEGHQTASSVGAIEKLAAMKAEHTEKRQHYMNPFSC